ncbi:MAG: arginase family protein [Bacteroidota bacterium]|nr:arginase family protein [Bacteroidota bacterium]
MNPEINIILIDSDFGAGTRGAKLGPHAIYKVISKSGSDILKSSELTKIITNDLESENNFDSYCNNIESIEQVFQRSYDSISNLLKDDKYLVVLSGDHSSSAAVISAIKDRYENKKLGVVWIDAHSDLHTPFTTPSGNMHGMALSIALGQNNANNKINSVDDNTLGKWLNLLELGEKKIKPKVLPEDVVLIDVRDLDSEETKLLHELNIKYFTPKDIKSFGIESILQKTLEHLKYVDLIFVSFDVDTMDPTISYGTGTPVPEGLTINESIYLLGNLITNTKFIGIDITETNPLLDRKNPMEEVAAHILIESFKKNRTNSKPKQILELEEKLKINIHEFKYETDEEGQIINLDLSNRRLNGIIDISAFENLKTLSLNDNNITEINGLENLRKVCYLDLSNNQISEIKGLQNCILLRDLKLDRNQIIEIKGLNYLDKLEFLNLEKNKISEIKELESLINLLELKLGENNIQVIRGLNNQSRLRLLNLNDNEISQANGLEKLNSLTSLSLQKNNLSEINNFPQLSDLLEINFSNNQICTIGGLRNLKSLKKINLNYNSIENLSELNYIIDQNTCTEVKIANNPFLNKFNLILEKDENHLPYLKELIGRNLGADNLECRLPVKIILLGNHACGKSSLLDYIINQYTEGSTHVLRIRKFYISEDNTSLNLPNAIFFDFGGQDFYHGLYRAFLSNDSLQIILFDKDKDKNEITVDSDFLPIMNFNRYYWLGQKIYMERSLGADPYIIIQGYADMAGNSSDILDYEKYPGFKGAFNLSFKKFTDIVEDEYFESGRRHFIAFLKRLITNFNNDRSNLEPQWYIDFLDYIFNQNDGTNKYVYLNEILPNYNLTEVDANKKLQSLVTNLTILHRHGMVLYYPHIQGLENVVWLSPSDLVRYIHENILIKDLITLGKGIIPKERFEDLINDKILLTLLREQKIIFLNQPARDGLNEEYIVPNFLPLALNNDPDYTLSVFGLNKPNFVIKFNDFIPFGFINQVICFYGIQPDVKKFWRNQLLFTLHQEAKVLISLDFEQLKINVIFERLDSSRSTDALICEYLFYSILALYWDLKHFRIPQFEDFIAFKSLSFEESTEYSNSGQYSGWKSLQTEKDYIPLDAYISIDDMNYVRYSELFNINDNYKIKAYKILNGRIDNMNYNEILAYDFSSFTQSKIKKIKKLFISYSKFDENYLQDFEDHLVTLKDEGLITFNCRKIEFGLEWDEEIKRQITSSDILICLVSVKFLNTDYIKQIEIEYAIEQNKIIIPIIIKACDWESSKLGKYQAAQRGKILSIDNDLRNNGKISGLNDEEKALFWTNIIKEFREKKLFESI